MEEAKNLLEKEVKVPEDAKGNSVPGEVKTEEKKIVEPIVLKAQINDGGGIEWSVPVNPHKAVYLLKVLEVAVNELMKQNIIAASVNELKKSNIIVPGQGLKQRTKQFFTKMTGR